MFNCKKTMFSYFSEHILLKFLEHVTLPQNIFSVFTLYPVLQKNSLSGKSKNQISCALVILLHDSLQLMYR